jgi:hypothetical protein
MMDKTEGFTIEPEGFILRGRVFCKVPQGRYFMEDFSRLGVNPLYPLVWPNSRSPPLSREAPQKEKQTR